MLKHVWAVFPPCGYSRIFMDPLKFVTYSSLNYLIIIHINYPSNVMLNVILNKLQPHAKEIIDEE